MGSPTWYWKYRDFQGIVQICHHRTRTNRIEQSKSLQGKLQSQIWKPSLWERFSLAFTASHSFKVNCQKNRLGCDFEDDEDQAKNKTDSGWPLTPRLNLQATSGWKTWLKGKTCTEDWAVDSSGTQKKNDISHSLDGCITIFPDAKIRAVVLGSLILMITAAKRCPTQKGTCQLWRTYNNRRYE
jgi:hypothetical protein